ncbi:His-Xaa-Ser system protein HxsD [Hymenobacter sediminis]|uniref:His-Xaa-Ser system protein HxsD n=1 Tax=Hymenobacter sediminis TaxID=2218621 RepID=UPI00138FFBD2|nr:His-Xaa-Ser system protein HxsD [Hymenobacter sediminis]
MPLDSFTPIELRLDRATYSEAVIYKCFYWYGGEYDVHIEPQADSIIVRLSLPEGKTTAPNTTDEALLSRIQNDLVDFKLRELIGQETQTIRELLVAKAFANYDTEQPLLTPVSDPVGFHFPEGEPSSYVSNYQALPQVQGE